MTYKEIRDAFYAKYSLRCKITGIAEQKIDDKVIALRISEAIQDLSSRVPAVKSSQLLALPANSNQIQTEGIGEKIISVGILNNGNTQTIYLERVNEAEILSSGNEYINSAPRKYAFIKGEGSSGTFYFDCFALTAFQIKVEFYKDGELFSPTAPLNDIFDGVNFTGSPGLPGKFIPLIISYLMGMIFPEYLNEYEMNLLKLKQGVFSSSNFDYNFGF
ncbi:MAG: hypothetical protein IAE91_07815 [Ignavibacteriaceae bacterium]|nr:hypothetical protein [Ignavibacteriaceae bacterium]